MNSTLRVETSIEDSVYRVYDDDNRDDKYTAVYLYGYGKSNNTEHHEESAINQTLMTANISRP